MRSHAAAPGKRGGGRKANAKGDAKNGKLFRVETPMVVVADNEAGLILVFAVTKYCRGMFGGAQDADRPARGCVGIWMAPALETAAAVIMFASPPT